MEEKILSFFYELCKIPRRSGNEAGVCAWLEQFARERGLEFHRDELCNAVIKKPAAGGGHGAPVVLQGHTDMVCAAAPGSPWDPERDGVHPVRQGDLLRAEGTTLGADNGIAVAMMLAILDADDLCHPPLECVFTVQEETGLFGAKGLDGSLISGRRMINLDSEEDGVATVSCAGGKRVHLDAPAGSEQVSGTGFTVTIDGLRGGHSGTDIGFERANAIKLAAELLGEVRMQARLIELTGGEADNAIPRRCTVRLAAEDAPVAETEISRWQKRTMEELSAKEPGLSITVTATQGVFECLSAEDAERLRRMLVLAPSGVRTRNPEAGGFVVSSENLGVAGAGDGKLHLVISLRSSDPRMMRVMSEELETLAATLGFSCTSGSEYPGWAYAEHSPLRDQMAETYRELFGRELRIEAIHAGLECGLFCEKLPGLDAVAIGPNITGCHTPEETLDLPSAMRVASLVCAVLKELAK